MGAYDNRYEFPIRMMNQDILNVLRDNRPEDTTLSELSDLDIAKITLASHQRKKDEVDFDPNKHVTWLEFYETRGEVEELEKVLKDYQIPFDRWCSAAEGNSPDIFYYRPDIGLERRVEVNHDGCDVIEVSDLQGVLKSSDVKTALEILIDQKTSENIRSIYDYTSETELGRNKNAMEQINDVLRSLDKGEIDNKKAMDLIADIRKGETIEQP